MIQRGSAWTVAALVAICATVSTGYAQDAQELLREARDFYARGRDAEALAKLNEVLATNPGSEDAWSLRNALDFQEWARIMVRGGQHEALVQRIFDLSVPAQRDKAKDPEAIRALLGEVDGDDFRARQRALFKLQTEHGEYVVPALLDRMQSEDSLRRAAAMEYCRRLGREATLPLIQALDIPSDLLRASAVTVLAQLGDPRGLPYVALVATETEGAAGIAARDARSNLRLSDPVRMHLDLAAAYYRRDVAVVDPSRSTKIAWGVVDGELVAREVPDSVYHLKLAEEVLFDLLKVAPDQRDGQIMLASVLLAQSVVAAAQGDEAPSAPLTRAEEMAASLGAEVIDAALDFNMQNGRPEVAAAAASLLGRMLDPDSLPRFNRGLGNALRHEAKIVRYHAAFAMTAASHGGDLGNAGTVVSVLGEALAEDATRTAVVIDDRENSREALIAGLNARGWFAYGAKTGALGLASVRMDPIEDLVIVRYDLQSGTADAVIKQLKKDERTAETVIAMLVEEAQLEAAQAQFGESVQVFISPSTPVANFEPSLREAVVIDDADRVAGIAMAARAARTLSFMPAREARAVMAQLVQSLQGDDSVRIPAMQALGRIGDAAAFEPVLALFNDGGVAEPVRAAAALCAAAICAKTNKLDPALVNSFDTYLAAGEGEASTWAALGRAVGIAPFSAAARSQMLERLRSRITIDTDTE